jgi:hypothetical protein
MKTIVLLVILGALAWWYFDGSRRMTEEHVRAHYTEQNRIVTALDSPSACLALADDYRIEAVDRTAGRTQSVTLGRDQACDAATTALDMFGQVQAMSGGNVAPSVRHEYKRIALSADRKTATVEYSNKLLLGDRLVSRSRTTETLIRRSGRILSLGGRTESWAYP